MIQVYPTAIGPNTFGNVSLQTAFYPLGCVVAYAKSHRDGELLRTFQFERITPLQERDIEAFIAGLSDEPAIHLLSCFVWNVDANLKLAKAVKQKSPGSLILVGGPHIPRALQPCAEFLVAHPFVDAANRNEGELTLAGLLDAVGAQGADPGVLGHANLSEVAGITFLKSGNVVRTPDRQRERDLSRFPSPYTSGEYDHWFHRMPYMPVETNRGCPYGCTFCDWGAATLSKIHRRDLNAVLADLEFGARAQTAMIGIVDANFGILPRDVEIAEYLVHLREKYGYPDRVGYSNAKVATPRLKDIARMFHRSELITSAQISIQTTDETVLANVSRNNIKTSEYKKLISFFHEENIPVVSDMMVGLPGQSSVTIKSDLQFFFDHKVVALPFATSVMPNAPMAREDYRKRFRIDADSAGMVIATCSFGPEEYVEMYRLCLAYKFFVKLGVARYILYFMQMEHDVRALEFIERWLARTSDEPNLYPISHRVVKSILGSNLTGGARDWLALSWSHETGEAIFGSLASFYEELVGLFRSEFAVEAEGSAVESISLANASVLPAVGRRFPAEVPVAHDVAGYFADVRKLSDICTLPSGFARLSDRPKGHIELRAQPQRENYAFADWELTYGSLELRSNLFV